MIKNLSYELIGKNEPVIVFLHGWGMDSSCFDGVINKLSPEQKILKIDFFSFGKSEKAEEYFDTYEYAYHIFLLIKRLDIKNIVLVGHSFGGRIAIILSSIFNLDIKNIILTSSAGVNRFCLSRKIKIAYYKFVKFLVNKRVLKNSILNSFGSSDYKKLDNIDRLVFIKVVNQDLYYLLKFIKCNTTLVWDKKDDITPYWICKKLFKGLISPNIELFTYGKHYAFLYNIDKFAKIMKSHII